MIMTTVHLWQNVWGNHWFLYISWKMGNWWSVLLNPENTNVHENTVYKEKNCFSLWQDDPTLLKERWGLGFGEANTWLTVSHCVFFRSGIILVNWQYYSHGEKRSHCQTDSFKMSLHGVNCQIWLYFSSSLISSILTRSRTPLTEMQPPSHDSIHADDLNQNVQIWIHPSIRTVPTDFQTISCVIWHSSTFSPHFPSLRTPNIPVRSFLMMPQQTVDGLDAFLKSCVRSLLDSLYFV